MIGRLIAGKYHVTKMLRSGGMGVVCEAFHRGTGKRVALKLILEQERDEARRADVIRRFEREARAAGAVDAEHIVQVFDAGTDEATGLPYMAMELLAGEDLQQVLRRVHVLPVDTALRIAVQACRGLARAEEADVIHRDIKPGNIFLSQRDGDALVVKVLDFGIAKVNRDPLGGSTALELTRTGSMLGSPQYMSPEQAKGLKSLDHRTDVWSLGVVLYKMLCGRTPHQDIDTVGHLIVAICTEPAQPVNEVASWVPASVAAVVARSLALDPGERFPSMKSMLEALEALVPDGAALRRAAIATAPEVVAARALSTEPPPPSEAPTERSGDAAAAPIAKPSHPSAQTIQPAPDPPTAPEETLSPSVVSNRRGLSRRAVFASAMLALAVGGVGAFALRPGFAPTGASPPTRAAPAAASAAGEPAPSPSGEPASTSGAEARPGRTVRVGVPAGASAWLDGAPAPVVNGYVEIAGATGSRHRLKVTGRGLMREVDVEIAAAGAEPPTVALAPATTPPGGAKIPTAGGTPSPAMPGPAAAPGRPATTAKPKSELGAATTLD